jgi:hypothetical protein
MEPVYRFIALWGRHNGGGRGTPEAPRSVITRYWKIIFRGFFEKIRG